VVERLVLFIVMCVGLQVSMSYCQVLTLANAVEAAEANNRTIQIAQLQRQAAIADVQAARTQRLPVFSITALGSQPLTQLGVTLERGSLGVYPADGPIPGRTTTLRSPLQFGGIFYATVAQPLTQQYKIGLGVELGQVGVEAAAEQVRTKRQAIVNEVRRLYYGIAQAESGRRSLQATVDALEQLDHETEQQLAQRVALRADVLNVKVQIEQAELDLLKLDDPIQTQKAQLNRLMGRDVDAPFEVDPASAVEIGLVPLQEARAQALASRPEVRLARLQVQKADLDRRLKSAERIPDVSLSFNALRTVNFSSVLPNNVTSVGLQVSWDVLDWGRKRKQLESKRDVEEQSRLELKDAEAAVVIDVDHHHRRLIEARQEVELARSRQASNIEMLRVVRNRYGQRDALLSDVIKAQSGVVDADHRYLQALLNLATVQADFEKAVGADR
jgi:outer membrane protein